MDEWEGKGSAVKGLDESCEERIGPGDTEIEGRERG
jgi:hypothetical protein